LQLSFIIIALSFIIYLSAIVALAELAVTQPAYPPSFNSIVGIWCDSNVFSITGKYWKRKIFLQFPYLDELVVNAPS
jgi:hypothetical protein